jgi:hypothetical protein
MPNGQEAVMLGSQEAVMLECEKLKDFLSLQAL